MSNTKFRFSICQEGFYDERYPTGMSFEEVCTFVASIGYEGLELAPYLFADDVRFVSTATRRTIAQAAQTAGLTVTGLHWLLVKPEGMHMTSPDRGIRTRTVDYLKSLCDFCSDVGGATLTLGSPKARNIIPTLTYEQAWDFAVEGLRDVGCHADQVGVTLCIESLPPGDTNFITTADEALRLAQAISSPGIAITLDVKSMCSEAPKSIPNIIAECRGWFRHFHANDANRRGPGYGNVDFAPILRALADVEYSGWVSVEAFDFSPSPMSAARHNIEYLRGCLDAVR